MRNIYIILFFSIILTSCSENSKFLGIWYNNSNSCDSLYISEGESKLILETFGSKFPAEVKDGYLEIYGTKTIKASLGKEDEILIDGMTYSKKLSDNKSFMEGDWKIYECSEKYEFSNVSIKNDTITISYGSPIEITGIIERISKDSISVKYLYSEGTIYMSETINEMNSKIEYEKPIAYILPKSKKHFIFEWNGISLKQSKEKWLEYLDDELYWGEKSNNYGNKIVFTKE